MTDSDVAPLPQTALTEIDGAVDHIMTGKDDVLEQAEDVRLRYVQLARWVKIFTVLGFFPAFFFLSWLYAHKDQLGRVEISSPVNSFILLILVAGFIFNVPGMMYAKKVRPQIMPSLVRMFGDFH